MNMLEALLDGMSAQRQFRGVLQKAESTGFKSSRNAVTWGAIMFAQSARARTKVAQRMRRIIVNPGYMTKTQQRRARKEGREIPKGANARWAIEKYSQRLGRRLVPVTGRKSDIDKQRVPNRGLSKRSWGWMLAKMNKPAGVDAGMNATGRERVDVQTQLQGANPTIRMRNELGWIVKANPGIINASLRAAANTMEKRIAMKFRKAGF